MIFLAPPHHHRHNGLFALVGAQSIWRFTLVVRDRGQGRARLYPLSKTVHYSAVALVLPSCLGPLTVWLAVTSIEVFFARICRPFRKLTAPQAVRRNVHGGTNHGGLCAIACTSSR